MKIRLILIALFALVLNMSYGQNYIQCTIKPGAAANQVDVYIKPNWNNVNPTVNLLQLQFPIAWLSTLAPVPTGLSVTIDPAFTAFFGTYGNLQVYSLSQHLATNDRYRVISMTRTAGTASTPWISGTEYKVLTASFQSVSPAPSGQVKVADYFDGGDDLQGNFYTVDGLGNYFVDYSNSMNNFYNTPGISTVGGTAQDGYIQTNGNILLPIDLLTFSGYKDGGRNQLRWTTSTEANNQGFDVQRSLDGVTYNSIGFVNSLANGGNSSVSLNYAFTDNTVTGLRQYYRLRQVDIGGNSKLSNIVLIRSDKPTLITIDGMFPNPATTTVNMLVSVPVKDKLIIQVYDMSGKIMMTRNMNVETGSNTLPINISALAGGNYMIKMTGSDGESTTGKFVKH